MNKFGLDDYTYDLLINFFKSKRSIKFVRIFGSRAEGNSRKQSDIDLIVEGTYSDERLYKFKDQINNLRHPYRIDLYNVTATHYTDPHFVAQVYTNSVHFYVAKDYFPEEFYIEQGPPENRKEISC